MWQFLKRLPVLSDPAVREQLKLAPGIRHVREADRELRRAYYRRFGRQQLQKRLARTPHPRVVLGAWSRFDTGWIPTQREFLDLTKPEDWRVFRPDSIDALLAEHVWEHLIEEDGLAAARTCFGYLSPGGYLRVAVPDGLLPDPTYIELVRPGGSSAGSGLDGNAANHRALYNYQTLGSLFEQAGFQVVLYEYFDHNGRFHYQPWDAAKGTISRSKQYDPRKRESVYPGSLDDYLRYVSLVLDAVKPGAPTRP
jgi:predicted SAM-dependent methyltransferase